MTLPTTDTVVLYPAGAIRNEARVLHVEPIDDSRSAVLLDATACHPVDAGWPDQGADRAHLVVDGRDVPILDCIVGATDGSVLHLGSDVPVRPGTDGWTFVVAHVVATSDAPPEDAAVSVVVDEEYRTSLSRGHTACHLASLALNRAVADRWTKEVRTDGLGQPDFDAAAIESSRIRENASTDVFRLNKSLRRKGFATEGLIDELDAVDAAANDALAGWVASGASVRIDRDGDLLTDRRYWVCDLPEASVRIACGGTHVGSLSDLGGAQIALEAGEEDGTPTLSMFTETFPRAF
ncbi:MAG: metal-dependent hydrolase [Leifsonia sp.]